MSRRVQTMIVAAVLALGLAVAGLALPVPFVTLLPGPVTDTLGTVNGAVHGTPLIQISGNVKTYPTTGKLELTTVEERPRLNLLSAMREWFASDAAVVPRELLQPPGTSEQQVQEQNTQEMLDSQDQATAAALSALNIKPSKQWVVIAQVSAGSPAAGARLAVGDRIVSIDGTAVTTPDQVRSLIGKVRPGVTVTLVDQRGSAAPRTVPIVTVPSPSDSTKAFIGIAPDMKRSYPFTVKIGLKDVGGPSAGLMFAIGIYDRLTSGDLAGGKVIAGTGTIDETGAVGPIGGIQQKLLGARRAGAVVFLVPSANCAEAKQATPAGLRLVKVDTLAGALGALKTLRTDPGAAVASC